MAKLRITTPATSANLGPGFDFLGIALSLYNIYEFEESSEFIFSGFEGIKDNYVYLGYKKVFEKLNIVPIPLKISLVQKGIPEERGLGSSSSAIVAGVLAGIHYSGYAITSEEEILKMMIELEGHPDNILPCFYGGLISTIKLDNEHNYYINKMEVASNLHFIVTIPDYKIKTSDARKILKEKYPISDVIYNSSRVVLFSDAFSSGDINLLKIIMKDKIHEPYRKNLIKDYERIKEFTKDLNVTCNISGSGPTILIISSDEMEALNISIKINNEFDNIKAYVLKVSDGAKGEII